MKTTTKFCKDCGKIMRDVDPRLKLCDTCRKRHRTALNKRDRKEWVRPKAEPKRGLRSYKSIEQCVREATALGVSYGVYVGRGLDRVSL